MSPELGDPAGADRTPVTTGGFTMLTESPLRPGMLAGGTEGGRLWLENGLAFGGADDTWSWLMNAGARTRVDGYHEMSNDTWSVHLAGGGSLRPTEWLRIFAASTTQFLAFGDAGKLGDIGGGG